LVSQIGLPDWSLNILVNVGTSYVQTRSRANKLKSAFRHSKNLVNMREGQHVNLLLPERAHRPHEEHLAHFAAGPDHSRAIGHNALVDGRRNNGELFQVDVTLNPEPVAASSPTPRAA
jgi:hypothetical protein